MKKVIVILPLLLSVLLTTAFIAYATDADQPKYNPQLCPQEIDDEILNVLDLNPSDKIVKVYNTPVIYAFSAHGAIEDVLNSEYGRNVFYVIVSDSGKVEFCTVTKELFVYRDGDGGYFNERNLETFFSGNVIQKISPNIKVHNVYYLSGENNFQGIALYYQTDMGDYVYYQDSIGNDAQYLMPVEYFHEYTNAVDKQSPRNPASNGWHPDYKLTNFAHFDFRNSIFDPHSPPTATYNIGVFIFIAMGVTLVAMLCCVIYWKKKRNA
jgi:hypothetical protein